jgi:hypothetical protein
VLLALPSVVFAQTATPTSTPAYTVCYTYDFQYETVNSYNNPINIQNGDWQYGQGIWTDENGSIIINWGEIFSIHPSRVSIIIDDNNESFSPSLQLIAYAFGQNIVVDQPVLGAYTTLSIDQLNTAPASVVDNVFSLNMQTSSPVVLKSITVYLDGASPYIDNPCALAPATPLPSKTPTPNLTATPYQSPTPTATSSATRTATVTASVTASSTPNIHYCYEWDFTTADRFGFFDISGIAGAQLIGAYSLSGLGYTDTYNSTRGARGIGIESIVFSQSISASNITVEYFSIFGGDTDPFGSAVPVAIYGVNTSTVTYSSIGSSSSTWTNFSYNTPATTINRIRLYTNTGISDGSAPADRGGDSGIRKVTVTLATGVTSNFSNGAFCDVYPTSTPAPTNTPLPPTSTHTSTATFTPSITRTPLFGTSLPTYTPSPTPLVVATRTPAPTNTPPPPTNTPPFPTLPNTPVPTQTRTPAPTTTPPPTRTNQPLPTLPYSGSSTPWSTLQGPNLTPLPGGTTTFNGITIPSGTLIGTPQIGLTTIAVPNPMDDFYGGITGNLQTAVANVNSLPRDISQVIPDISSLPQFAGQAKWIMSGVSLQEIFGQRIYPIPLHMFYGLTVMLFIVVIVMTFRVVMWFIKLAVWVIRFILKIIPFIG